jgi:hypothetical protein
VWRNAPGPTTANRENSVSRGIAKRPRGSIVGLLLDNSTKKSQTLNHFGNTLNDAVCVDAPEEHAGMAGGLQPPTSLPVPSPSSPGDVARM